MARLNKTLQDLPKDADFCSVEVEVKGKKESVHVSSLFWGIMNSIKKDLDSASKIATECSENCKWKENLDVFTGDIVNSVTGMMALCDLRKKSQRLQHFGVPAASDTRDIQDILDTYFPKWKEHIKEQVLKHLNKALIKEATTSATQAVLLIVKKPIQDQVLAKAKQQVLPKIINDAKSSGKSAAKRVFDDRRAHISLIGQISSYGWVKSVKLVAQAKGDAINDAKNAAKATVNNEFNSPAIKNQMKQISEQVSKSVFAQHKAQIDEKIKNAVDDTLNHHKLPNEQFIAEMSK